MDRGSCVDCEERDAVIRDQFYGDELCSTCYTKRIKNKEEDDATM